MGGEVEALGGLVTAGLAAGALDGPQGATGHAHQGACANCGTPLAGPFCGNCGQNAHIHRTLGGVFHDFLHGITHFDGKAWKTLPMLLFRPGKLTRDYIEGKRARYIAPVPLFLLVVFLMFFVFSFVHIKDNIDGGVTNDRGEQMTQAEAKRKLPEVERKIRQVDAELAVAKKRGDSNQIAFLKGVRVGIVTTRNRLRARAAGEVDSPLDIPGELAREMKDRSPTVNMGNETLNEKARAALKNPELVFYKIQGKAYKLSFLLVPMSLPWLWLMFAWKRGVKMYDHAIFALYSISFMSLLFIVASIALALDVTDQWLWIPLLITPVVHMYFQLKGAYSLSRFSALWRTGVLSISAFLTLAFYLVLIIAVGVLD
ncbi:MAG: hypothetical protein CFE37_01175 [Alphaproteobacteria bacterium PA4]|nr:MAG: hypothetical protein CFE37_01175 [Alphaproteobacteria bacterium PA4]